MTFLVVKTLGKRSFLMQIHGYVLSSFSKMLYRGCRFLIRLFSNNNASISVSTTIGFMAAIFFTKTFNRAVSWCLLKRSEEHTSELQSRPHLVCRLLLEKKKTRRRGRA